VTLRHAASHAKIGPTHHRGTSAKTVPIRRPARNGKTANDAHPRPPGIVFGVRIRLIRALVGCRPVPCRSL
jgi:hypothetical protein